MVMDSGAVCAKDKAAAQRTPKARRMGLRDAAREKTLDAIESKVRGFICAFLALKHTACEHFKFRKASSAFVAGLLCGCAGALPEIGRVRHPTAIYVAVRLSSNFSST